MIITTGWIITCILSLFLLSSNLGFLWLRKLLRLHGRHMRQRVEERRKLVVERAKDEYARFLQEQKEDQRRLGEADALHRWGGAIQQQQQQKRLNQDAGGTSTSTTAQQQPPTKRQSHSARASGASLDDDWERVEQDSPSHDSAAAATASAAEKEREHRKDDEGEKGNMGQDWDGVVGFFHPFCNAGGGGERVLWTAIRATQKRYPKALCVVYTGDHEADKQQMLEKVEQRFSIHIHPPTVVFMYLSTRRFVLASTWPRFTLLGQSLGSLIVAYDAFSLLVPDIFIDTMGYAFALALSKGLFPEMPTGAYVHYPTISTDMLGSLDAEKTKETGKGGIHAGTGSGMKGRLKRYYWNLFAQLYGRVGASIDVVMTNSSWTQDHIEQIWGPARLKKRQTSKIKVKSENGNGGSSKDGDTDMVVVFPPVAVTDLERAIPLTVESENLRTPTLIYIAQFRPEKNHELVLRAFAKYLSSQYPHQLTSTSTSSVGPSPTDSKSGSASSRSAGSGAAAATPLPPVKLNLIGSVRDDTDRSLVYSLRLLAHELHITDSVSFILDASWPECVAHLRTASVGVNAMWNEHFGIGVVEYQAAGLLAVVNSSGGPKRDIVVPLDGGKQTGWWASTVDEYAAAFKAALDVVKAGKGHSRLVEASAVSSHEDKRRSANETLAHASQAKEEKKGEEGEEGILEWRKRARRSAARFNEEAFEQRWNAQLAKLVDLQLQQQ